MKRYELHLTMNCRDLGGYKTLEGKVTRYFRFIRSDAPTYITESDKQFLLDHRFSTIIDLRTEKVVKFIPSVFAGDPRFEYRNFPLTEGSGIPLTDENASALYLRMIGNTETFFRIFSLIAEVDGGVFYHCTAGKDRTGILSCLLLLLAGAKEEDILNDYCLSNELIEKNIGRIIAEHPSFPPNLGYAKRKYLEGFLTEFRKQYGTAEKYLLSIGLSESQIGKIKRKLTED